MITEQDVITLFREKTYYRSLNQLDLDLTVQYLKHSNLTVESIVVYNKISRARRPILLKLVEYGIVDWELIGFRYAGDKSEAKPTESPKVTEIKEIETDDSIWEDL